MELIPLYSGSDGNATAVVTKEARLLFDCGGSCKSLETALASHGICPADIDAVFVTHEHSDHISASAVFAKKYAKPIHITGQSAYALTGSASDCAVVHSPVFSVTVADATVTSFVLPHDSALNVGYRITDGNDSVGIATDMGTADAAKIALTGCSAVVIEANHDVTMLKNGLYPAELKARILSARGHLSNTDSASLAVSLAESGAKSIMLAHISRENNTPKCAFDAVRASLDEAGLASVALSVCPSRCSLKGELCLK